MFGIFGRKQPQSDAFLVTKKKADEGDLSAQYNLGVMYLNGMGVARNPELAHKTFMAAADRNHPRAQYNLGIMYNTGTFVQRDPLVAANWLSKAAQQGHADAAFNLAHLFLTGTGVKQDNQQAHQYMCIAADNGHAKALSYVRRFLASRGLDENGRPDSGDSSFTADPSTAMPDRVKSSPRERQAAVIELDSGRQVAIDSFSYSRTYAGLLEGRPSSRLNSNILRESVKQISRQWGDRKVHLISPEIDETDPNHPKLPPTQLGVWLTSTPLESGYCGSALVVVWFSEKCESESLLETVRSAVSSLHWDALAEDFDF